MSADWGKCPAIGQKSSTGVNAIVIVAAKILFAELPFGQAGWPAHILFLIRDWDAGMLMNTY